MSFIINRVYTGVGDAGTTRLAGGQEFSKADVRIEAYGTVDELNAVIGVMVEHVLAGPAHASDNVLVTRLRRIQNELFDLGGELAVLAEDRHPQQALVQAEDVVRFEKEIDEANADLPALRSFVLPGGGMLSALMHQARTVCRRAERRLIALHEQSPQRELVLRYVNRLSDWLFVMGRQSALSRGHEEVLWKPGDRSGGKQ
ncbi:MAG: cob(I)yrinic acid a,c-diamide adenosyltransferase [Myxococcota bacterium]